MAESQVGLQLFQLAEQRAAAGELEVAARFAARAREVFEEAGEHDGACAAGSLEGRIRLQSGDVASAEEGFRWVINLARAQDLVARELAAMTELGALLELTGNLQGSLEQHTSALRRYRALGNSTGTANALGNVGRLLTRLGRNDEAAEKLREALDLFQGDGELIGSVNALICLGDLARSQGKLGEAKDHFEQAVAQCDEPQAAFLRAVGLLNLGHTARDLGDSADALRCFAESRAIATDLGDAQGVARARLGEAMALADSSSPQTSIEAFEAAETAFLQIGQPPAALAATVNKAAVLCRVGRLIEGRDALVHARELLRRVGDRRGETEVVLAFCEVALALGDAAAVTRALDEVEAAPHGPRLRLRERLVRARMAIRIGAVEGAMALLSSADEAELSVAETYALGLIKAEVEILAGMYTEATARFDSLLEQLDHDVAPRERAAALMGRALVALWTGELDLAERQYESSAAIWRELGEPLPELQCRLALARIAAMQGVNSASVARNLGEQLRDLGAVDAADAAVACSIAMELQQSAREQTQEPAVGADHVVEAVACLVSRENYMAAFSELVFAQALTKDAEINEELTLLGTRVQAVIPPIAR